MHIHANIVNVGVYIMPCNQVQCRIICHCLAVTSKTQPTLVLWLCAIRLRRCCLSKAVLDVFLASWSRLGPASALTLFFFLDSTTLEQFKVTSSTQLRPLAFFGIFLHCCIRLHLPSKLFPFSSARQTASGLDSKRSRAVNKYLFWVLNPFS
jgi:hypothetical protein